MTAPDLPLHATELPSENARFITDFSSGPDLGWYVVNDNVMGGRSDGGFEQEQNRLVFKGSTNTNGGGFSSIRTKPLELDLSAYEGIRLQVRGDGRRYTWRLTTNARTRGRPIAYWADFETVDTEWATAEIPFSKFVPRFRGSELDGPELDTGQITGMGLMIYDKQDGAFEIHIAGVQAYSAEQPFSLSQYQWQNRVLVLSAATGNDKNLQELSRAIASTHEQFADRDLVLITLLDEAGSKANDRSLTTAEVAATRSNLEILPGSFALRLIGKDGSVKLAESRAVPVADVYALIDTMPMRKREMPDR
ncbi:MAG: DUF4174 domain-containing protein [Gammaproteobacteria bacterium]|nr:DUF4174 domain-containing protein [Gammaproteobacteria bacterium]